MLQINGQDVFGKIDPIEMNAIYEFNNKTILNQNMCAVELDSRPLKLSDNVVLCLVFNDLIYQWSVKAFFEIEMQWIYHNGLFGSITMDF